MSLFEDYEPAIKTAVDEWLGEQEGFGLRFERMPDGLLPWIYEAAKVGATVIMEDKVEGLLSDLDAAVEVAWNHGAYGWVRLNHPKHYKRVIERQEELEDIRSEIIHNGC